MKKKLGSKLANGVHEVKALREQRLAEPVRNVAGVKPSARPVSAPVTTKSTVPSAASPQPVVSLDNLHPARVWPD